ncbi:MAG: hypothetical protein R6V01_07985 [Thermoplasmatota archaeon]
MSSSEKGKKDENGLETDQPLGKEIGSITVAVRPPDPLLIDKLREGLTDMEDPKKRLGACTSLGIRSMDGFYFFPDAREVLEEDKDPISVVQYDPVRRVFLLSDRTGSGNEIMELFWYAFKVFPDDHVLLLCSWDKKRNLDVPERTDERVDMILSIMKDWKQDPRLAKEGMVFWRGKDLISLFSFINDCHYDRSGSQSISQ